MNRRNLLKYLSSTLLASLLIGCGPGKELTKTLVPVNLGHSTTTKPWSTDGSTGTGPDPVGDWKPNEDVLVGYEFNYDHHDYNEQHFHRGAVKFDLKEISDLSSKSVEKATLTFRLAQTLVRDYDGKSPDFVNLYSCVKQILLGSNDWPKLGKVIEKHTWIEGLIEGDEIGIDTFRDLPYAPPPTPGAKFEFDVTSMVQRWVAKPEENFGWILRGRKEEFGGASNEACKSRYSDFSLNVVYKVF